MINIFRKANRSIDIDLFFYKYKVCIVDLKKM